MQQLFHKEVTYFYGVTEQDGFTLLCDDYYDAQFNRNYFLDFDNKTVVYALFIQYAVICESQNRGYVQGTT